VKNNKKLRPKRRIPYYLKLKKIQQRVSEVTVVLENYLKALVSADGGTTSCGCVHPKPCPPVPLQTENCYN
jgi:tRNA U54 and U55 pseudouridine synthase Pus10